MSQNTEKTAEVKVAEKVEKITRVKANSRGYAFLGKLTDAPDFKALKNVEFRGQAGTPLQEIVFSGEQDAGNMLRRGYLAVGPDCEVDVEVTSKGILVTPVVE